MVGQLVDLPFRPVGRWRGPWTGRFVTLLSWVVLIGGVVVVIEVVERWVSVGWSLAFALAGFLLVGIATGSLARLGQRLRAPDGIRLIRQAGAKWSLFLRPFAADEILDLTTGTFAGGVQVRHEDALARAFRRTGPLVTIGRPAERLPETGAARVYVADEEWREAVRHLLPRAEAVVLVVGDTEAVRWELEQVVANCDPRRVLIEVPHRARSRRVGAIGSLRHAAWRFRPPKAEVARIAAERVECYGRLRAQMMGSGVELPGELGDAVFVHFDDAGTPRLLPTVRPPRIADVLQLNRWNRLVGVDYRRTLRPFFEKLARLRSPAMASPVRGFGRPSGT